MILTSKFLFSVKFLSVNRSKTVPLEIHSLPYIIDTQFSTLKQFYKYFLHLRIQSFRKSRLGIYRNVWKRVHQSCSNFVHKGYQV